MVGVPLAAPAVAAEAVVVSGSVSLGFEDGARVELPADDPRARAFRAAAAALLETPQR